MRRGMRSLTDRRLYTIAHQASFSTICSSPIPIEQNKKLRHALGVPLVDVRPPIRVHVGADHAASRADHPRAQRPNRHGIRQRSARRYVAALSRGRVELVGGNFGVFQGLFSEHKQTLD
jgi:hypothetical protein